MKNQKPTCRECGAKATDKCSACGAVLCGKHSFLKYVDDANENITKHAPIVCAPCHPETLQKAGKSAL